MIISRQSSSLTFSRLQSGFDQRELAASVAIDSHLRSDSTGAPADQLYPRTHSGAASEYRPHPHAGQAARGGFMRRYLAARVRRGPEDGGRLKAPHLSGQLPP